MSDKPKKLFLVWQEPGDGETGFFNQYDTMKDAIDDTAGGIADVYTASIKYAGKFKMQNKAVRIKQRKKPRNK